MPKSIKKTGYPDGVYGKETVKAITLFQKDNKLTLDGKAGKNTITLMDKLLLKKFKKIAPPLKTHKLYISTLPKDRSYTIGTKNPALRSNAGAGAFNSVPMQFSLSGNAFINRTISQLTFIKRSRQTSAFSFNIASSVLPSESPFK